MPCVNLLEYLDSSGYWDEIIPIITYVGWLFMQKKVKEVYLDEKHTSRYLAICQQEQIHAAYQEASLGILYELKPMCDTMQWRSCWGVKLFTLWYLTTRHARLFLFFLLSLFSIENLNTMKKINNFASGISSAVNSPIPTSLKGTVDSNGGGMSRGVNVALLGECKKAAKILNSFMGRLFRWGLRSCSKEWCCWQYKTRSWSRHG